MSRTIISGEALQRALAIRDLCDPAQGPHAMQSLLAQVQAALAAAWQCEVLVERRHPVVTVADNYDNLRYPADGVARDARYSRYVSETELLRTQTSALIPPLLRSLSASPPRDALLVCPGLVYRRDTIDRLHTGEPHQVDLWRLRRGAPLTSVDLHTMIGAVVRAMLPGRRWRTLAASHPYTLEGLQIDVEDGEDWVEIGECGLAHPAVLEAAGLDAEMSGLAMGIGLDRGLMLRKGVDDIRLLRDPDERIAAQMLDLEPYRPVSRLPPIRRDLSLAVAADTVAEELGDRVRAALGDDAVSVEATTVVAETPGEALPAEARERIGLLPGQKNVLLRVVLRHPSRTLTSSEANVLRDAIYAALHEGSRHQWAASDGTPAQRR